MKNWIVYVKFINKITGKVERTVRRGTFAPTFEKAISNVRHVCVGDIPCTYVDLGSYEVVPKEVEKELHNSRELTWEEKYQNLLEEDEVSDQELADLDDLLK